MDYLLGNDVADTGNGTHGTNIVDYSVAHLSVYPGEVVRSRFCW